MNSSTNGCRRRSLTAVIFAAVTALFIIGCAAGDPYMRLHQVDIYKDAEGETTGYVYRYEAVYPKSDTEKLIDIAKEAL